jgi:hypothetical protein
MTLMDLNAAKSNSPSILRLMPRIRPLAALAHHLGKERGYCASIIAAIQRRQEPIQQQFCSDAGVRLMRIDSELILSALRGMHDAGHPALPVHDARQSRRSSQGSRRNTGIGAPARTVSHRRARALGAEGNCEAVARPTMRFVGAMNRSPTMLRGFGFRSNKYGFTC